MGISYILTVFNKFFDKVTRECDKTTTAIWRLKNKHLIATNQPDRQAYQLSGQRAMVKRRKDARFGAKSSSPPTVLLPLLCEREKNKKSKREWVEWPATLIACQ